MPTSVWEALFMLVVLKIPVVYMAVVVWWAVRPEPGPTGGADDVAIFVPLAPCGWDEWRRRRSPGFRPIRPTGRPFSRARRVAR